MFAFLPNSLGLSTCYQMLLWPAGSGQVIEKLQHCCNMSLFHAIILVLRISFSLQTNWKHEPAKERAHEIFHLPHLYKVFT